MWAYECVFYHIYPLGFCGAPVENDGMTVPRIQKITAWIDHMQRLGVGAVYLGPVFSADRHGYDTRDFRTLDCRLGDNEDFRKVCDALHTAGIRVVLDGVFNHVGRGFWAFQDVLNQREQSPYCDWFVNLNFSGDNGYGDGLSYEGWEGHLELVKLNLRHPAVVEHLLESVGSWIDEFQIDGLRLDVAYCLDTDFIRSLRTYCDGRRQDFFLLGEVLSNDYSRLWGDGLLHSVTDYPAYKGLWSSLNSLNFFEINATLEQQFIWQYPGLRPMLFADNHDVNRAASVLENRAHLPLLHAMTFALPGFPCVYYGSEWGVEGVRDATTDYALRPSFQAPMENELTAFIAALSAARKDSPALRCGSFRKILLTNRQYIFERTCGDERVLVALNADGESFTAHFNAEAGCAIDLITGAYHDFGGGSNLPPYSVFFWRVR